jgi:hypothetical protein
MSGHRKPLTRERLAMTRSVAIIDVGSIQSYIFASDVVREVVGASFLVRQATETWPAAHLVEGEEILSAGGGQCRVLLLGGEERVKQFFEACSRHALINAPGLSLAYGWEECDWDRPGSLSQALVSASAKAARQRSSAPAVVSLPALPVSARCQSTREAASMQVSDPGGDTRYVSDAVAAKRQYAEDANRHLEDTCKPSPHGFPWEFDKLGRTPGESSYIGVIHIDGNRMGERIQRILKTCESDNEQYKKALSGIAGSIEKAGVAAIRHVTSCVRENIRGSRFADAFELWPTGKGGCYLPIRPLVYGGDDVTIVCDGRIALSVAAEFLTAFGECSLSAVGSSETLDASAGVAIVKSHYPFAQAYQLADDLADSAKQRARIEGGGALDWHLSAHNLTGDLDAIRVREYGNSVGGLLARPWSVGADRDWRTWKTLLKIRASFLSEEWEARRGRRRELLDVLREGPDATRRFVARYVPELLPEITSLPNPGDVRTTGWHGDAPGSSVCVYYDAVEMLGLSIPLKV